MGCTPEQVLNPMSDIDEFGDSRDPYLGVIIDTLEGKMQANIGDMIIKGVKGEFYPCKPDIFKRFFRTLFTLAARKSADGQRKLDICKQALVLYKIVALENKSDSVVAVCVPVLILILFG